MADQEENRDGPNRRRRLDDRDVAAHVHQKYDANINHDDKKELDLNGMLQILTRSNRVDNRELTVQIYYDQLPGWVPAQPVEAQSYYTGMQTLMKRLHLNRCKYFMHLLKGRRESYECKRIHNVIKMSEKELEVIQTKIDDLGGRIWLIPKAFSLDLALIKKEAVVPDAV